MTTPVSSELAGRIPALDFTKGVLVLFMVLYHWLNYFVSPTGVFYEYLRFVTLSFIFISGFLVTNVGLGKYRLDARQLRVRLAERGFKLLLLFTVLNIACGLLSHINHHETGAGVSSFFKNAPEVYLVGNERGAAFQILVPISYVLLIASLLTVAGGQFKAWMFGGAIAGALLIVGLNVLNRPSGILYCLGCGVLGLCVGAVPLRNIESLMEFPAMLVAAYCIYLAAVAVYHSAYLVQLVGSILTLLLVYCLAKKWESKTDAYRLVVKLGQYSLFAYIAQIGLLQLMRPALRHVHSEPALLLVSFVAAFALTVGSVGLVDWARSRGKRADRIYRLVFA